MRLRLNRGEKGTYSSNSALRSVRTRNSSPFSPGILFFVGVVRSFTRSLASSPFRILLGFEETSANIEIQINCPLQEKKSQVK